MLATASAVTAASAVAAPSSGVVGHLYVNDNTTGVNTVAGFDRHSDGSLTPIPGSPFAVGGAGTGHGVASQGSLQLSGNGRYLLAVDAGSNEISVLRVADGRSDRRRRSDGANPVSTPSTATRLRRERVADHAELHRRHAQRRRPPALAGRRYLPDASQRATSFQRRRDEPHGTRVNTSLIDSFTVEATVLTAAAGSVRSAGPRPLR
jgi:hypothetical protein